MEGISKLYCGYKNMCLDSITSTNIPKSGIGWKIVVKGEGIYNNYWFHEYCCKGFSRKYNRWCANSKRERVAFSTSCNGGYTSGFHIFKTRKDARIWMEERGSYKNRIVVKVKYRQARILGIQSMRSYLYTGALHEMPCIVADELLVIKNKSRK